MVGRGWHQWEGVNQKLLVKPLELRFYFHFFFKGSEVINPANAGITKKLWRVLSLNEILRLWTSISETNKISSGFFSMENLQIHWLQCCLFPSAVLHFRAFRVLWRECVRSPFWQSLCLLKQQQDNFSVGIVHCFCKLQKSRILIPTVWFGTTCPSKNRNAGPSWTFSRFTPVEHQHRLENGIMTDITGRNSCGILRNKVLNPFTMLHRAVVAQQHEVWHALTRLRGNQIYCHLQKAINTATLLSASTLVHAQVRFGFLFLWIQKTNRACRKKNSSGRSKPISLPTKWVGQNWCPEKNRWHSFLPVCKTMGKSERVRQEHIENSYIFSIILSYSWVMASTKSTEIEPCHKWRRKQKPEIYFFHGLILTFDVYHFSMWRGRLLNASSFCVSLSAR